MQKGPALVLITNLLVTGYLTGLIWTIQHVHYPLFANVGAAEFAAYHAIHNARISDIVLLPMVIELVLSFVLITRRPASAPLWLALLLAALTVLIWLATFLLSVPAHDALGSRGLQPGLVDTLVNTNWPRTIAWTARLLLLGWVALRAMNTSPPISLVSPKK